MTLSIYARRKIKIDEEVTIAYIDILDSRKERQRKLQLIYGFACACDRCDISGPALEMSDKNRELLRQWVLNHMSFDEWLLQTAEEKGDIIAVGRYFISNPDLPLRWRHDIPLTEYNRDTFYLQGDASPTGYTDYPFAEN